MEHIGSMGAGTLSDTDFPSSMLRDSEWQPKSQGQATSANLNSRMYGQTNVILV